MAKAATLLWENATPFIILGSGSNILVSDKGIDTVILHNRAHNIKIDTTSDVPSIYAESGAILGTVARQSALRGLSGLEWAAPVPGTVGGAVYGNAGAHGSDMAESLKMAEILHKLNGKELWPVEKLAYQYRSSVLKRKKIPCVILSATFNAVRSSREAAWEKINAFQTHRKETQPPVRLWVPFLKNPWRLCRPINRSCRPQRLPGWSGDDQPAARKFYCQFGRSKGSGYLAFNQDGTGNCQGQVWRKPGT